MTLRDFLLNVADIGSIVLFHDNGWQIGCTMVDNEYWFIDSLNQELLDHDVMSWYYAERDWTTKPVIVVEL